MSLFIAERLIQNLHEVSELARLAMSFVDGGSEWLHWAVHEPTANYQFEDESEMAAAVQEGLHVSRFAFLPQLGLMVSPVKLMTLGLPDLRVLANAEAGEKESKVGAHARRILSAHDLLTQADFDTGTAFLTELGVAGAALFQFATFGDRLAIYDLVRSSVGQEDTDLSLQKEAAAFAVAQGRTAQEFVDFYAIYMALAAKGGARNDTPAKRAATAQSALHTLLPLMFGALNCPEVEGLVSPEEVTEAVKLWLSWGRSVGFSRLSSGARQIVENTRFKNEGQHEAREIVDAYLAASRALLAIRAPHRSFMAQDGATCQFSVESHEHEAELQLDPLGVISLTWFRRRRKPEPQPKPKSESKVEPKPEPAPPKARAAVQNPKESAS